MLTRGSTAIAELTTTASRVRTWNIATPLTPVGYYPRSGLLPAVLEVRNQTGTWDKPGQTRTLMLSDGGSVVERIMNVEPHGFFAYNLTDFTKIFGKLVDHARAEWTFSEVAGGTTIHWSYTFFPKSGRARPILATIVTLLWGPYMRRVLPRIVAEVERQVDSAAAPAQTD
ncbi:MAG TPA: SRPBCC family protein [Galbitalea sp.]|nr:SRPBCC family protein [Galbitalea sp.]